MLSPRYNSLFSPGDCKFLRWFCVNVYYKTKSKKQKKWEIVLGPVKTFSFVFKIILKQLKNLLFPKETVKWYMFFISLKRMNKIIYDLLFPKKVISFHLFFKDKRNNLDFMLFLKKHTE